MNCLVFIFSYFLLIKVELENSVCVTRQGPPPPKKKVDRENVKIWLKIQRIHVNKFADNGNIITNFYPDDVSRARGYKRDTNFGRLTP